MDIYDTWRTDSALWWILFCCSGRLAIGRGRADKSYQVLALELPYEGIPKMESARTTNNSKCSTPIIRAVSHRSWRIEFIVRNIFAVEWQPSSRLSSLKCPLDRLNHAASNQKPSTPSRVQDELCHFANPRSDFAAIHSRATPPLRSRLPAIFHGALPITFYFHTFFYPKYSRNSGEMRIKSMIT